MKNNITDYGDHWIYHAVEPVIGEHAFIEYKVSRPEGEIFIQVDFYGNEYTFSASATTVLPFFADNATDDLELPELKEIWLQIPNETESPYIAAYHNAKLQLDRSRGRNGGNNKVLGKL